MNSSLDVLLPDEASEINVGDLLAQGGPLCTSKPRCLQRLYAENASSEHWYAEVLLELLA